MQYDHLERADVDHKAETVGLWPGIAGVYVEAHADVFCPECAEDMLGKSLYERVKYERVGHDHDRVDEFGNIAVVLANEEWDCPGATCGHCGISLDVRAVHYDGVCQPEYCPEM